MIVLGIGATSAATEDDAMALAAAVLREAGLSPEALDAIATLDRRADHPAVQALAASLGVPLRGVSPGALAKDGERAPTPSTTVARLVGVPSVAEAAALSVARGEGGDADLLVPKRIGEGLTAALARSAP